MKAELWEETGDMALLNVNADTTAAAAPGFYQVEFIPA
jgi:hypothetical protein